MTEKTNGKTTEADTTEKTMEDDYAIRTIILQCMCFLSHSRYGLDAESREIRDLESRGP